jgi:hypothetical protein
MEPAHSETGDCRVEPPASILVARLSMSHLAPLLEFNQQGRSREPRPTGFSSRLCVPGELICHLLALYKAADLRA